MRHAVVVAPPRYVLPSGSVFEAPEPVGPLCAALARGGRRIVVVPTTPELETDFERGLAGVGAGDELFVHVCAATTTQTHAMGLRVADDGGPTLGFRVMSDAVLVREPSDVLFAVEARHDGAPDDPVLAAEHVDAIMRALDARARGYGALVGVGADVPNADGGWPFTRRVLAALGEPEARDDRGAAPISLVYERLRAQPVDGSVQSFSFVRGRADFVLIEPPGVAHVAAALRAASMPPPSGASAPPAPDASPPPPSSAARAPRSARHSEPSLPPLEPLLNLADGARDRGALEEALAGYKAALMVASASDGKALASIYAHIGGIKRAQGKAREAERNFEKACCADPAHRPAIDALVELATEANEIRRAVEWRRKRLAVLEAADDRRAELVAIARALADDLNDPRAAAEALEEAHAADPRNREVVEALRAAYEKLHRWPRVIDVLSDLADVTDDPRQRAALRFAAADVALGRLRDEERGLGLLDRALDDDPTHDQALHALVAVRTARGEWEALDAAYTRLVDRFARLRDVERAWDACRKLGVLRRDKTRDVGGAVEAFLGAVSCKPGDVDSRAMLAEMHLARGDEAQAVAEFERIAQHAPARASTYARLFALHQRAGRTDRAWLAACALEELGAADIDSQIVVDQYRPDGPIRPSRSLDDVSWELLRAPGADDVVADVLRAVVDAAVAAHVEVLREARKLPALDPSRRQTAASTVSAVRSFHWAAQVLGIDAPDVHVLDDVPGGVVAVPSASPAIALGPDVLRGLTAKDLAFLAGRHLTYHRREHYVLVHHPTIQELSVLFLAAVKLVMPGLPAPAHLSDAITTTCKLLGRQMAEAETQRLEAAVKRLDARDGRVDLAAWVKSVELTAHRAGLLLCGDLAVATARMRAETRQLAELTFDQKRGDLLAFCASEKLSRARQLLTVDAHSSMRTPPASQRQVG